MSAGETEEQWVWFEYRWRVLKEEIRKKEFEEPIQSPMFLTIRDGLRYRWQLDLFPKGAKSKSHLWASAEPQPKIALALYIHRGGIQRAVEAKYKASIVGSVEDGNYIPTFTYDDESLSRGIIIDLYRFDKLDDIGMPMEVEFRVQIGIRERDFDLNHIFPDPQLTFCPKGLALYQQTVLGDRSRGQDKGDVVLVAEGGERIHCHQLMLDDTSTVFQAMLLSLNGDTQIREVDIPDVSADTLKQLLYFLYAEALPDGWKDDVLSLLYAADKYDVMSLDLLCEKEAVAQLSLQTAAEFLKMGIELRLRLLKMKAIHFILDNWKELPKEEEEKLMDDGTILSVMDVSCMERAFEIMPK